MSRPANPDIAIRNERIVDDHLTRRMQPLDLSTKHGLHPDTIRVILRKAGAYQPTPGDQRVGTLHPSTMLDKPTLSQLHVRVGAVIDIYLSITGEIISQLALRTSISWYDLTRLKAGIGDITLTQMQKLCGVMGIEPHELVNPAFTINLWTQRLRDEWSSKNSDDISI